MENRPQTYRCIGSEVLLVYLLNYVLVVKSQKRLLLRCFFVFHQAGLLVFSGAIIILYLFTAVKPVLMPVFPACDVPDKVMNEILASHGSRLDFS